MSIADDLKQLETLLQNGTLTQDEFQLAKRRLLEDSGSGESSRAVRFPVTSQTEATRHLEMIQMQNAVAQLDREWELEREDYMVVGKYGRRYIPNKVTSVLGGLFAAGFGIFWTMIASSMPRMPGNSVSSLLPFAGVGFTLFGAGMGIWGFIVSERYEAAFERYQSRRRAMVNQFDKHQWNETD